MCHFRSVSLGHLNSILVHLGHFSQFLFRIARFARISRKLVDSSSETFFPQENKLQLSCLEDKKVKAINPYKVFGSQESLKILLQELFHGLMIFLQDDIMVK